MYNDPRYQQQPPGYYMPPGQQRTPPPVTNNLYYGQPQYQQPQPQRSGCRSTLTRRVSVPLWLVIVCALITIGSCTSLVANQQTTQNTAPTVSTPDSATSQPQTPVNSNPTPAPTIKPTPTHTPKWTTIQTFSGNGSKKTPAFTVPDNWQLVWSCDPSSSFGGSYNVIVAVVGTDGSQIDPTAVNTICQSGNKGDQTQEYQGGSVYLDVQSEGAWTIKVKALE